MKDKIICGIIAILSITCLYLWNGLEKQKEMIYALAEFNTSQLEMDSNISLQGIVLKAIAEDYPPKMNLSERSWCIDKSCLK